jgi:hypothetical protein
MVVVVVGVRLLLLIVPSLIAVVIRPVLDRA